MKVALKLREEWLSVPKSIIMFTILLHLTILEGAKMSECLEITAIVR